MQHVHSFQLEIRRIFFRIRWDLCIWVQKKKIELIRTSNENTGNPYGTCHDTWCLIWDKKKKKKERKYVCYRWIRRIVNWIAETRVMLLNEDVLFIEDEWSKKNRKVTGEKNKKKKKKKIVIIDLSINVLLTTVS